MQVVNDIRNPTTNMIRLVDYLDNLLDHNTSKHYVDEHVKNIIMVIFDNIARAFDYDDVPDKSMIYLESTPDLLRELASIYPPTQMTDISHNIANLIASIVDDVSMKFMEELMTTQVTLVDFNRTTLFMVREVRGWIT